MYPHQIRLGPPWERLEGEPARWRRRFGRPRQIDDWERVWLIPIVGTKGEWRLNQAPLEWNRRGDGLQRADVTGQLKERNEIVAELTVDDPGAILEIGCRAFIQDVKIDGSKVAIVVSSESADDPLELYVMIDGETHGYFGPFSTNGMLTQEFRVVDLEWKVGAVIRVDLICRSTIWDTIESSIVY